MTLPGVAPVQLPAPAPGSDRAPSLAFRAFVSVSLLVGLFVLAFAVVLALIGLNVMVAQTGRIVGALVVVTLAVVLSIGRGLFAMIRKPPEPEDEIEVPAAEEPELHERLRQLAAAVGTRPPDRVVVIPEVNAYVREFGPLMGLLPGERTLAIGTPLLDVLSVSQLEAVLAHELGHLAGGDTRLGPLTFRTDQATLQMVTSQRGRAIAAIFMAYWKFQHRVSATVRRGQELVADGAAVRVAGRQAAADALNRVDIAGRAEALYRRAYLIPLLEAGCRPADLVSGMREILRDVDRVDEIQELASVPEDHDPWSTHPPTTERIARLAAFADPPELVTDDRPARVLWRNADRWAGVASETWLEQAAQGRVQFRTVPWTSFGEETAGSVQRDQAGQVDRLLGAMGFPPGLDGLRSAMVAGHGAALAGELIASGWRAPGVDEREAIQTAAVLATAIRTILDERGGRFLFSWSEPLVLADGRGRPLPIAELARSAVVGSWDGLLEVVGDQGAEPLPPPPIQDEAPVGALPQPPCPPFEQSSGEWLWELKLPATLGKKNVAVAVGVDAIAFDKAVTPYDEIESVSFKLESQANLTLTLKLGLGSGKTVKLVSAAMGSGGKANIEVATDYLWRVLRVRVGPRLRQRWVSEIESGAQVKVGNVTLSREGATFRTPRAHLVPWSMVVDAVIQDGEVHIVLGTGKTIPRPLASVNAFLLPDLIPELHARFG